MRCSEEALWLCSLFSRLEHLSLHIVSAQYICWLANQSVSWQVPLHVKKCRATSCRQLQWFSLTRWHPTPVLLPGKSHGRRSLEDCSPWGRWGSDTTEGLHFPFSLSCIGEGNGNPLQCSCLENPSDAGAWWAAVYVVAQSWTRLKWLSSSSRLFLYFFAFFPSLRTNMHTSSYKFTTCVLTFCPCSFALVTSTSCHSRHFKSFILTDSV